VCCFVLSPWRAKFGLTALIFFHLNLVLEHISSYLSYRKLIVSIDNDALGSTVMPPLGEKCLDDVSCHSEEP